jgi:glycosyltransferase involved in cell wall biosynthesis
VALSLANSPVVGERDPIPGQSDGSGEPSHKSRALSVSLVIPTKNEARNVAWVLERVDDLVDEIIIVDGLSTDDTVAVAKMVRPDVRVVSHPVPGKGEAIRAGFAASTGDVVVMIDADGSMDPGEIPQFVRLVAEGYDLVKGSRCMPGGGSVDATPLRAFGNSVLVRLANLLLGTDYTELCYGYMALRRSRIRELGLASSGFEIETEIVVNARLAGLAIAEVPSFEAPRRYGTSNLNTFRDGFRVLRALVFGRFQGRQAQVASEVEVLETSTAD